MKYILQNIPFFAALGVLGAVLVTVFFTRITSSEHKKALRNEFCFCFGLCILTFIADLAFMPAAITEGIAHFASMQGYWWGTFTVIMSNIFAMLALSGAFMLLRAIPFCGKFLQWTLWLVLTIPFRLFYLVTNIYPTSQDIMTLFSIKFTTTLGTVIPILSLHTVLMACIPNIIAAAALWFVVHRFFKHENNTYIFSAFLLGLLVFAVYFSNPKGLPILRDPAGNSMKILYDSYRNINYYLIPRKNAPKTTRTNIPHDNIVFILDESIRGDYLSINNPGLNTSPRLEKYLHDYQDNIFNYGLMLSAGTHSFPSRAAVMTGQSSIPDNELQTLKNPTIFDLAKANGYRTVLINVQGDFPDWVFRRPDMDRVDEVYLDDHAFSFGTNDPDFNAASFIHKRITEKKGQFIFLEKFGAHDPYEDHYPGDNPKYQVFMPKLDKAGEFYTLDKRRKVINSYKNAVRYNIDGFFSILLGENPLNLKDCTIIWTSDHGQSFMEYGQFESHLTGYLEQAIVPFMIFSTEDWVLKNLRKPEEISGTLSHLNIDPTMYSLLYRDVNYRLGEYDSLLSAQEWRNPPRIYLHHGTLWEGTASKPVSSDINGKITLPLDKYMY